MAIQPQHLIIANLLANPALSNTEIAEMLDISHDTVYRVKKMLSQATEDQGIELEAYKMLLRDKMPPEIRVSALRNAVDKADSNPFAALKAVEYTDAVLGLSPKSQQPQEIADNTRPMFILPSGTSIQVSITTPADAVDITPKDE
jgi:hypothetical protein